MNINELYEEAIRAMKYTYSPFSGYPVGGALAVRGGRIYLGTNIENDSYGLTICAERSSIFSAISNGESMADFEGLAVATKDGGTSCGACRQVLFHFNPRMPVFFLAVVDGKIKSVKEFRVKDLLPNPFTLS